MTLYEIYLLFILIVHSQMLYSIHGMYSFLGRDDKCVKTNANIHQATNKTSDSEASQTYFDNLPSAVDNHISYRSCDYLNVKTGKRINPYKVKSQPLVETRNVASVCLKCAACLAIAQYMNDTTMKISDKILNRKLSKSDIESYREILKCSCSSGFGNHDLRTYDGKTIVTEISTNTKHVLSSMDGKWTALLRKMCLEFVNNLDFSLYYNTVLTGHPSYEDLFCRNYGLFRHCKNLNIEPKYFPTDTDLTIKFIVTCENIEESEEINKLL